VGRTKKKYDVLALAIRDLNISDTIKEDSMLRLWHSSIIMSGEIGIDTSRLYLSIFPDESYSVVGNTVIPANNFNGTINLHFSYTDSAEINLEYAHEIVVTPVNDKPVIVGFNGNLFFSKNGLLEVSLADFTVDDPDNAQSELSMAIIPGDEYTVLDNTIQLLILRDGIEVPVTISDGLDADTLSIFPRTDLVVDPATGLGRDGNLEAVSVYPNPFSSKLVVVGGKLMNVFDSIGRDVIANSLHGNDLETTSLPAGVYILRIETNGHIGFFRVVKQ
jgi:hypothetical protein